MASDTLPIAAPSDRGVVQSLDRALSILDVVSFSERELPLGEIAARSGLAKSTTHRLLRTLELRGFVARNPASGNYRPGLKNFRGFHSGPQIRRALADLAARSGETANLGTLVGSEVLYVDRAVSPQALRWQLGVGERVPVHCSAMGKAMIAFLDRSVAERVVPARLQALTASTVVDRPALFADLARTRRRGFAVDDEEFMEGVRCVAVPVCGAFGEVAAAISIAGPAFRLTREVAEAQSGLLTEVAAVVARHLGWDGPLPGSPRAEPLAAAGRSSA